MEPGITQAQLGSPIVTFVLCVLGAASIATAVNQIWKVVDRLTGKSLNQPLEVKQATMFVAERDCLGRYNHSVAEIARVDHDLKALREERSADLRAASESRHTIYEKIEEVREEMNSGFKDTERALGRIEGKISS